MVSIKVYVVFVCSMCISQFVYVSITHQYVCSMHICVGSACVLHVCVLRCMYAAYISKSVLGQCILYFISVSGQLCKLYVCLSWVIMYTVSVSILNKVSVYTVFMSVLRQCVYCIYVRLGPIYIYYMYVCLESVCILCICQS